jgi:hypothetical protein
MFDFASMDVKICSLQHSFLEASLLVNARESCISYKPQCICV